MNSTLSGFKAALARPAFYIPSLLVLGLSTYFIVSKARSGIDHYIDPAFAKYIAAYTAGTISRESAIRIELTANFGDSNTVDADRLFSFDPGLDGTVKWIDASTIEFKPEKPMPSGTAFEATFYLGRLIELPDHLREFRFRFSTVQQAFEVAFPTFEAMDNQALLYQRVSGALLTADAEDEKNVEQLLNASHDGVACTIRWEHAADKRTHRYVIDSVMRKQKASEVTIGWNGKAIGVDSKGGHKLGIPGIGDFKVVNITAENDGEQYVSVFFSDPLLNTQDLAGLITFGQQANAATVNSAELRFTINGNEVKCYPGVRLSGTHTITVHAGIKNVLGKPMPEGTTQTLTFTDMKPAVSFIGKGVILPASNKLMLPFEAVGLNAVDITVVKIYENNVAQFLQVNDLAGSREIVRVGRPVLKKTMRLDTDRLVDLHQSNRFAIELDKLMRTEPGAVYHVKISFKKSYSLYRCGTAKAGETNDDEMQSFAEENWDGTQQNESTYWDSYEEYYSEDFNWNERDNPCHSSYYNMQRWASRNVMASDLGIIAKQGTGNELLLAVTDLVSTKPLAGVTLNILDYQQQTIVSATTNGDGMATVTATRKPYLLVAKYKEQRGYLKLDDGSSLPLSHFDVSGDVVQKGLKGFIYGERGVWRPGDSIYLTFMLEDRNKTLPAGHPVSMELYDPNGVLYKRMVQSGSTNGFYSFHTSTDAESPTGNWSAKVKVGGATFQKMLKIETVMPNRLKIELAFAEPYLKKSDQLSTTLKSRWLHGAIAGGLNAQIDVTLTPALTAFKAYPDYAFDDPTRRFSAEVQTVFNGKLDQNGQAAIHSDLTVENRPAGMLHANFTTKVFEAGGNFSIDRFSVPFHPYDDYFGVKLPKGDKLRGMLLTDTSHTIEIVNVDPEGRLVTARKTVKVSLYKIRWRWWWDRSDEDLSSYAQNEEYEALQEQEVQLVNGKARWTLRVNYPEWGRYFIRVSGGANGHSTGKAFYMDWPGWAGRAQRDNAVEASMLTFTSDKTSYRVGDEATLSIPTAKGGRALVSIESGSEVIEAHWVEAQPAQTSYKFRITKNMMPNVFVHVTLVQPHAQTANDLPVRLYGMLPVKVEDPATVLKPVIGSPASLKADETAAISVSEASGKAMTYTLAIVDEGLLDLTRFKTPDPYSNFYAREALGVKTWDLYDFVIGAFGMQMNRVLSIGGDEGINRKAGTNKANRFKPVVKFIGPFHVKAGQTATHQVKISNYVGSVRMMVVAGNEGAYGFAEKAVAVKKPLMVLATLPRVLGPGETVKLPVTVFAMEKNIRQVNVQVTGNALVQVEGPASKSITFSRPGDEVITFDLKVKSLLGIGKVKILATGNHTTAGYEVELDVRNPNPYVSNVYEGTSEGGKKWSAAYTVPGIAGTNTAVLEVSSIPPLNLEKRLRYLIQYPHGCVEQTTSAAFPQLALNKLLDLNEGWKKQIEQNVTAAIQRLKSFQNTDGGMAYWPGESRSDEWSTSYAGHFMTEALNAGYSLPVSIMASWKRYQRNQALAWMNDRSATGDLVQAYRLYTLALAKAPELGAMNRLKEIKTLSVAARWRLAAAYVLAGQKETARQLVLNQPVSAAPYILSDMTFGSETRDEAMILETLTLLDDKPKAATVMQEVCRQLGSDTWMSTQTTAYALMAVARTAGKISDNQPMEFTYTINGQTAGYRSGNRIAQFPVPVQGRQGGSVSVTGKSARLLYTRLIVRGQPEAGEVTAAESNLGISVVYKDMKGTVLNPAVIEQGTDFKAEVTVSNPGVLGHYEQMALTQIFPSGWEIHNARMSTADALATAYSVPRYQDVRDDRVLTYFSLPGRQKVTYAVLLNASYLGRFYLPGVSCEAMYDGRIHARTGGTWVEVVPRKTKTGVNL